MAVYLVRKLNSDILLDRLKQNSLRRPDYTKTLSEFFQVNSTVDAARVSSRSCVIDPLPFLDRWCKDRPKFSFGFGHGAEAIIKTQFWPTFGHG